MQTLELLTDDERRHIEQTPEGGFIPAFVEWAGMKTDASAYILRAAALTALSLAAGDTVTTLSLVGSDHPTHLNLYVLIVGPSTTTRKTTTLNLVRDLLPKNQQTKQTYIEIIGDASPQALNKAAAEAGKTMAPMLLSVDEVAGFFGQAQSRTGYMAGMTSALMGLYGHDPVNISRTQQGDTVAPRGGFVGVFAASTPGPLAEVLTTAEIDSGLLPRFLVFDAEQASAGTRLSLAERHRLRDERAEREKALAEHLLDIARERANGIPSGTEGDGLATYNVTTLEWDANAIDRMQALDDLAHETRGGNDSVAAIVGRSFEQVTKLAALYALSRGGRATTVTHNDVLRALALVETTGGDLLDMKTRLGENGFERNVRAVVDRLNAHRSGRLAVSAISTDLKLNHRDTQALIDTLNTRGLARRDPDKTGYILAASVQTKHEKRIDAVRREIIRAGGEWVTATDLTNGPLKRRTGAAPFIDELVETEPETFQAEVGDFNGLSIRAKK